MKKFKVFLYSMTCLLILLFVTLSPAESAEKKITLKFAGVSPVDHFVTDSMRKIAKEIHDKTNGRIEVKVYPANQLGGYELLYEELVRGTLEMALMSFSAQLDPRNDMVYIQGYCRDYEKAKEVFNPNGWMANTLREINARLGVRVLGMYMEGLVGACSVKPIKDPLNPNTPKGVLMRIPNMEVFKYSSEAVGYNTITIPYADVYQSLQTGVCDGDLGYSISAAYAALGDVIKHYYVFNKNTECFGVFVSEKVWKTLSPEDQEIIRIAAEKECAQSIKEAKKNDEKYLDLLRKKGVTVHMYTSEELKPLMAKYATTWDKLKPTYGDQLIEEFKANLGPDKTH